MFNWALTTSGEGIIYSFRGRRSWNALQCHIPYLTSNLSSPTPTFRTYLRPLLRRYLYFTSSYPFVDMQPPLLFLSISTSFYCSLFSYCPLLSSLPTCILTCNIRPLLSLLSIT